MAAQQPSRAPGWLYLLLGISIGIFVFIFIIIGLIGALIGAIVGAAEDTSAYSSGNVAYLRIDGVILTQGQSGFWDSEAITSSEFVVSQLHEIKQDDSIKAVLIEINSPGGSGVASDEIATAIDGLDKPTVAYIREVGASGAYWVASSTDHIIANRMSTVGSIGVIASYLDFSEFIERYNVSYQRFVAGDHKDFGTPFREPTPEEEQRFQAILDELHGIFIQQVAQGRNMSISEVEELADGFIYTGNQALELGLIDQIGGKDQAIAHLEEVIGEPVELVTYEQEPTLGDLLFGVNGRSMYAVGRGIGDSIRMDEEFRIRT